MDNKEQRRAELEAARNEAYPVPDSPHTSVNMRAIADRTAFTRGWVAALARRAPAPQAAQPRQSLLHAAINCAHSIDANIIKLHRDPKLEGNALSQLGDRLEAATSPAPAVVLPAIIREALEATFEQRPGHLTKVAAAIRALPDDAAVVQMTDDPIVEARKFEMRAAADQQRTELQRMFDAPANPCEVAFKEKTLSRGSQPKEWDDTVPLMVWYGYCEFKKGLEAASLAKQVPAQEQALAILREFVRDSVEHDVGGGDVVVTTCEVLEKACKLVDSLRDPSLGVCGVKPAECPDHARCGCEKRMAAQLAQSADKAEE